MTAPARHHLASTEVLVVDFGNHSYHAARRALSRGIRRPIYAVRAGVGVAVRAIELKGGGHEPHGLHEIVNGNAFEYLDVFEDLFGKEGFVWGWGLSEGQSGACKPGQYPSERRDESRRGRLRACATIASRHELVLYLLLSLYGASWLEAPRNSLRPSGNVISRPLARKLPS